jgi:hypothetical protein
VQLRVACSTACRGHSSVCADNRRSCTKLAANNYVCHLTHLSTSCSPNGLSALLDFPHLHKAVFVQTTHDQYNICWTANVSNCKAIHRSDCNCLFSDVCVCVCVCLRDSEITASTDRMLVQFRYQPHQACYHPAPHHSSLTAMCQYGYSHYFVSCKLFKHTNSGKYTGWFVSPSGTSELCCTTTKTDTAERSISIGREYLQFFLMSLPMLTCSPSAWPSRLLYCRGRKSRRGLWITLYIRPV